MRIIDFIKTKERRRCNINSYKCQICGNTTQKYIGVRNGKPYCHKCLTFRGQEASDNFIQFKDAEYSLAYHLSEDQKKLSKQLVDNYKNGCDSLVHAVCGRPKTRKT